MFEVTLELHNEILSQIPHPTHKPSKLCFRGFADFQPIFVNEKPFSGPKGQNCLVPSLLQQHSLCHQGLLGHIGGLCENRVKK